MIGRICPVSIKSPIWISCSRFGSTTNQAERALCAFAFSAEGGLATSRTPGRSPT
jgi:hypothetical protein